jgi:hypothetical protein
MSADIEKMSVFDARIVQHRPRYAVEKGALSLTNAPFNAIAATSSQLTFNIYVPSENVFVDRKLDLTTTMNLYVDVTLPAGSATAGTPIALAGLDMAVSPFPFNSICSTTSATINDTTAVMNTQDVLKEVLRLADQKKNRLQRTCPTMLDKYQSYDDAYLALNNTLGSYQNSSEPEEQQNGGFPGLSYTNKGAAAYGTAATPVSVTAADGNATAYYIIGGVPVVQTTSVAAQTYRLYLQLTSTEPVVLSPLVFADCHEWDTGLFGINNIQLVFNLQSSIQRLLRYTTRTGRSFGPATLYTPTGGSGSPFSLARINVQFLTPSLDIPLPPKSVVPYMEFPRYISQPSGVQIAPNSGTQIQSQTITLPQIPDLLIIFVKAASTPVFTTAGAVPLNNSANAVTGSNYADFYLPLTSAQCPYGNGANVTNPVSFNFDNFSGLLSSHTTEELYSMCVKNGLEMDWGEWSGIARSSGAAYTLSPAPTGTDATAAGLQRVAGQLIPTVGSILVLKPSQDITLQSGQAPSLVGNFTLQFNLNVWNNTPYTVSPTIYTITANSGFFESIRGSSRIIKGVLSEQDIISAPVAPEGTRQQLDRVVGGASFKGLSGILHKARRAFEESAPVRAVSAAVQHIGRKMRGGDGATGGAGGLARRLM